MSDQPARKKIDLIRREMPKQEPKVRAHNFSEVALGYTAELAMQEARRCLDCKKPLCMPSCPVNAIYKRPDGLVILEIDLNQSRQGQAEEGVVISKSSSGETIRYAPRITTTIHSVVKVPSGKTAVVAGAASQSGPRRSETLLLVSARVLNIKGE